MNVSRGKHRLDEFIVAPDTRLDEVIRKIDRNAEGIALVVDSDQHLVATITDGDIRRAVLASVGLDTTAAALVANRTGLPVTRSTDAADEELIALMLERNIRHVPLTDSQNRLVDLALLNQLVRELNGPRPVSAVVMAGGFGKRLGSLTESIPKPMLKIGDRPLLERIIDRLREAGIHQVSLTTHYRADVIEEHFGNGDGFGVSINYVPETEPRGTAGSLSNIHDAQGPILMMNGDIVTDVNFRAMLDFHEAHEAAMTVAVRAKEFSVPYGVVEIDEAIVTGISEKPNLRFFINAGIYLINPEVLDLVPQAGHFDMPDLIRVLIEKGQTVASFPIREYWRDIGEIHEYNQAQAEYAENQV